MRTENIIDHTFVLQIGLTALKAVGWRDWPSSGTQGLVWKSSAFSSEYNRPYGVIVFEVKYARGRNIFIPPILTTNSGEVLKTALCAQLSTTYLHRTLLEGTGRLWWLFSC